MKFNKLFLVVLLVILSGCMSVAKNASDMRSMGNKGTLIYSKESLVVDHSLDSIEKILKSKSKDCLNRMVERRVEVAGPGPNGYRTQHASVSYWDFKTDVVRAKGKLEMLVRVKITKTIQLSKEPEEGFPVLLVDIIPKDKTHSEVNIYYTKRYVRLFASVKDWVNVVDSGCPELEEDVE